MNVSMIRYILFQIMRIEGVLMLLPCLVAAYYRESVGVYYISIAAALLIIGFVGCIFKPKNNIVYLKEGCISTALSWIVMSIFGCLPFCISGEIPSFTDALFETVSGFTTTGASILNDIESLSRTALMWRSFTHWVGGMGVLVFLLAVIPMSGGSNINLMRAESPGPSVGKLVPKLRYTARILYLIYFAMTVIETILLMCGGVGLYESLTIAFGTAGTGGFAILNTSFVTYTPYIQWVTAVFMMLFAVNFNAYYYVIMRQFRKAALMEEVRWFFLIVVASTGVIFINILKMYKTAFEALTHAFFQVTSIMSTTGFGSTDFDLWPTPSKFILVLLMFIGACAGSTGGGIKVSRIVVLMKTIKKEIYSYIHPKIVRKVSMDGHPVEHDVIRSINVYMATYIAIFAVSMFIVSFNGYDLITTFTAVTATINNIGPGLSLVGPTCNYSFLSGLTKYTLIFDMLAGRLELFPMLMLFQPVLIKDLFKTHK